MTEEKTYRVLPKPAYYPDYWECCQHCGSWNTDSVFIGYKYAHYKPDQNRPGHEVMVSLNDDSGGFDHSHFECNDCGEANDV